MKKNILIIVIFSIIILNVNCSSKRVDVNKDINADTGITNIDIKLMTDKLAASILERVPEIKGKTIALRKVDNLTAEHFNTKMISEKIKDSIRYRSGAIFVERDKLSLLNEEQNLINKTGNHKQQQNQLWGADYLLYGRIDSITKVKKNIITKKTETYYRLSLSLTNSTTGVELWADQAEFKKRQTKSRW